MDDMTNSKEYKDMEEGVEFMESTSVFTFEEGKKVYDFLGKMKEITTTVMRESIRKEWFLNLDYAQALASLMLRAKTAMERLQKEMSDYKDANGYIPEGSNQNPPEIDDFYIETPTFNNTNVNTEGEL